MALPLGNEGTGCGDVLLNQLGAVGSGSPRGGVLVEQVNLLKGQTLGLWDTEVGEDQASETGGAPDEEDLDLEVGAAGASLDEVGGGEGEGPIPEPVRGSGEGHTLGTDVEGENFTGDDPGDGTPGGGEEGNVDAGECDQDLLSGHV